MGRSTGRAILLTLFVSLYHLSWQLIPAVGAQNESALLVARYQPSAILNSVNLQEELQITDEQLARIKDLDAEYIQAQNETSRQHPTVSGFLARKRGIDAEQVSAAREAAFVKLKEEYFEKLNEILLPHQISRYKQLQGWGKLLEKGRFDFFYEDRLVQALRLTPEQAQVIRTAADTEKQAFMEAVKKEFERQQEEILSYFNRTQRDQLTELGKPQKWIEQVGYGNPALRTYPADWRRKQLDDFLHSVTPYRVHAAAGGERLFLSSDTIADLNELQELVFREQRAAVADANEFAGRRLRLSEGMSIHRKVADQHLVDLRRLISEELMPQHEALQFELRSLSLGPFRQYGDAWLLTHLKATRDQEENVLAKIELCTKEFDEFLIELTHLAWKRILNEFPPDAKNTFKETLGDMIRLGHLHR